MVNCRLEFCAGCFCLATVASSQRLAPRVDRHSLETQSSLGESPSPHSRPPLPVPAFSFGLASFAVVVVAGSLAR